MTHDGRHQRRKHILLLIPVSNSDIEVWNRLCCCRRRRRRYECICNAFRSKSHSIDIDIEPVN